MLGKKLVYLSKSDIIKNPSAARKLVAEGFKNFNSNDKSYLSKNNF